MAKKKASDFRYNTGETKVPWAAVGENYNAEDLMAIVKFMMKGDGADYDAAVTLQPSNATGRIQMTPGDDGSYHCSITGVVGVGNDHSSVVVPSLAVFGRDFVI